MFVNFLMSVWSRHSTASQTNTQSYEPKPKFPQNPHIMSTTILSDIYHLVRQSNNEKNEKTFVIRTDRQDSDIFASNFVLHLIVFAVSLGLQTAILYFTGKCSFKDLCTSKYVISILKTP